jgi:hypothetical protein
MINVPNQDASKTVDNLSPFLTFLTTISVMAPESPAVVTVDPSSAKAIHFMVNATPIESSNCQARRTSRRASRWGIAQTVARARYCVALPCSVDSLECILFGKPSHGTDQSAADAVNPRND